MREYNRQYGQSNDIDYRSVMPTKLYGPVASYYSENSHVIPALIRRFHDAKINNLPEVAVRGIGTPRREFLHVDDMAEAAIFLMCLAKEVYSMNVQPMESQINVGSGEDIMLADLAKIIKTIVGYSGRVIFDGTKPDGSPQKRMDSSKILSLGWRPIKDIVTGLNAVYCEYSKDH